MHQTNTNKRNRALAALLILLATLALAACGSSSSSTTTATATTAGSPARGAFAARFAAVRACLQKDGITLPKRTPGQGRPAGGFLGGGSGPKLPAGVTRAQYEAAIKKCGGFGAGRFGGGFGVGRFTTPAAKAALAKFATCMRENGIDVPAPNSSGKGPIFNTSGLDTSSAKFRSAQVKCSSALHGLFGARPGATGAPGGVAGAPPAGGAAPGEAAPGATG